MFDKSLQCLHHVKIAFLFIPLVRFRLEHEQILLDLLWAYVRNAISWALTQVSQSKQNKQAEQAFKVEMQQSERKNHNESFCAMSQLLNKMKDFVKRVKYYLRYVNKGTLSEVNLQENFVASAFQDKKHDVCVCT